jgi:LmbE family N-acetylglucosaminyl deacetylase
MSSRSSEPLSFVAIGAHMDDTWMGMGGAALKAVRKGHRVTMV